MAALIRPEQLNRTRAMDLSGSSAVDVPTEATSSSGTEAASAALVDAKIALAELGNQWKPSVRVATVAAVTIASDLNAGDTIDGIVLAEDDRVLVKDNAAADNGIYIVDAVPFRSTDMDDAGEGLSAIVAVEEGTVNADRVYLQTDDPGDPGTSQVWELTAGPSAFVAAGRNLTAGAGLTGGGDLSADRTFDVGAGDGINVLADSIEVDVTDIVGTGVEDDGSNNVRISTAAAGDGLQGGGGSALAVDASQIAGTGLEDDGSENLRIAAAAAGDGLTGGAGSALAVDGTTDTFKMPVRLRQDSNVADLAAGAPDTVDGIGVAVGDYILAADQSTAAQDGIYRVDTVGTGADGVWSRAPHAAAGLEAAGWYIPVLEGSSYADSLFRVDADLDGATIDTDGWTLAEVGGATSTTLAGDGLVPNGAALDVNVGTGLETNADTVRIAAAAAGDGLQGGAGSALAVDVSAFAGTGLEDDGSENLRIAAAAAGDGLTGGAGSALAAQADGGSISVGASGIKSAQPHNNAADRNVSLSAASAVDDALGHTLSVTTIAPGGKGYWINGVWYEFGDGVKTKDLFASNDGGSTALAFGDDWTGATIHAGSNLTTALPGGTIAGDCGTAEYNEII